MAAELGGDWDRVVAMCVAEVYWWYELMEQREAMRRVAFIDDLSAAMAAMLDGSSGKAGRQAEEHRRQLLMAGGLLPTPETPSSEQ